MINGKGVFKSLTDHRPSSRMQFMHPITTLLFGAVRIPSDLSLEAADTLSLYHALTTVRNDIPHDIQNLEPLQFFRDCSRLLRQTDVLNYEHKLKKVIEDLLQDFDARKSDSPLGRIIVSLRKQNSPLSDDETISKSSFSLRDIRNDILVLLSDLYIRNDLVGFGLSIRYLESDRRVICTASNPVQFRQVKLRDFGLPHI